MEPVPTGPVSFTWIYTGSIYGLNDNLAPKVVEGAEYLKEKADKYIEVGQ